MVREDIVKKTLILLIIIILAIFSFFIARPLLLTVITSLILAYIFHPLHLRLSKIVRYQSISAAFISVVIVVVISLLTWLLLPILIRQTFTIYTSFQRIDFITPLRDIAPKFLTSPELMIDFTLTINGIIAKTANSLMSRFEAALTNLPLIFFQFVVMLFLFFYALRDSDKIITNLKELSPFNEATEKKFINKFNDVTKSVIYGMFVGGIIQGLITGLGLYIFGAQQVLFLTLLAVLFGILPVIGTWAVWVPVSVGMLITGNFSAGMGLILYSTLVGIWVDFFVRQHIAKRSGISVPITLVGMLGGGYFFGIIGLVIGPLILSYLIIFLEFYKKKTLHELFE